MDLEVGRVRVEDLNSKYRAGRTTDAESALSRSPNRLNSLYGAGRAAELNDDDDTARDYYTRLVNGVVDVAGYPPVSHARRFLEGA